MARAKEDLAVVGKNWARLDGADKVTGRSIFADDVRVPGMLFAKVVRSPQGWEANFVGLSFERAELACRRLHAQNVNCIPVGPGHSG